MKLKWMNADEPLRVDWPVTIEAPADDGGVDSQTVTLRFEIIENERATALLTPPEDGYLQAMANGLEPDQTVSFLAAVVVGWRETDVGLPFSRENLDRLIRFPFARQAVFKAYGQAAQGRKVKN